MVESDSIEVPIEQLKTRARLQVRGPRQSPMVTARAMCARRLNG